MASIVPVSCASCIPHLAATASGGVSIPCTGTNVGFAAWWGAKTAARDALKAELEAKGLDMSTVDNIAVLKWVAEQDKLGRGKQAVKQIYAAYETESNPWSPFFKPVGAVGKGPKK